MSYKPATFIDSHQHFWSLERGDYRWLTPELSVLYRDFLPADLRRVAQNPTPSHTVLVQAADTDAETDYLLKLAQGNEFIAGVVGWVDFEASHETVASRLKQLSKNKTFKGVRPMLQDIEDVDWILNPSFDAIFSSLVSLGLTFDALVKTEHLQNIYYIATRHPNLNIVIDHCAKPDIANGKFELWAQELDAFKALGNVYIKLSGLPTEASKTQVQASSFKQYFNHVYQLFGASRMMWGSDWPVVNLNSSYEHWLLVSQALTQDLSVAEQDAIWSGTATEFYQLHI